MENIKNIIKDPFSADNLSQKELETIIEYANEKFFNTNKPIMEDAIYDILIDFLKNKYPKSLILKKIGANVKSKNKVKLDYWLGSMNKIKPDGKELNKWLEKYNDDYVLSDKLDGISALLIYRTNGNINMYIRGTSSEGTDITSLLKYINVPSYDIIKKSKYKANKDDILMAFRGELIIKKNIFIENWSKKMKNARNTVSGLVHSKNINPKLANDTNLVIYEIIDPLFLPKDQLIISKKLGFNTVSYIIYKSIDYIILSNYLKKRRIESEYIIDGVIVTNNGIYERNIKSNPDYSFAFKDILEDQITEATINNIEWNISKDGLIKPVLIINPVNIGGVTITRVTGNNARNIVDNKLGKDAIIKLIRSGDVIPKIIEVIKPAKKIDMPDIEWEWNETEIDIISKEENNKDILIKNIYYFFSSLDTKGLGIKIAEKLFNNGLNSVIKILKASVNDLKKIEGFKEKSSENLINSIKKSTQNIELSKLILSTNKLGHGIGEERIKIILDRYPNILDDYNKWTKIEFINKLKELNGLEEKTSTIIVNNFDELIKFYNEIKDYITIKKNKIIKNIYTDKNIVISGFRDSILKSFLENSGAKVTNSINKKTDLLIVKNEDILNNPTDKVKKALDLKINIILKSKIQY
jgi:NAD-dependent DNA ligase